MGWFGPSGDCGCCDTYICADHTCTSRVEGGVTIRTHDGVELDLCECYDTQLGAIRQEGYDYVVHLSGTATGRSGTFLGQPYSLTTVDISGSYSFSYTTAESSPFCIGTHSPFFVKLHSEYMMTSGGSDYYAIVWLFSSGNLGDELICEIAGVTTGNPEPTSPGTGGIYDEWDYDELQDTACDYACTCIDWRLINSGFKNYAADTDGFDLSDCTATSEIV